MIYSGLLWNCLFTTLRGRHYYVLPLRERAYSNFVLSVETKRHREQQSLCPRLRYSLPRISLHIWSLEAIQWCLCFPEKSSAPLSRILKGVSVGITWTRLTGRTCEFRKGIQQCFLQRSSIKTQWSTPLNLYLLEKTRDRTGLDITWCLMMEWTETFVQLLKSKGSNPLTLA